MRDIEDEEKYTFVVRDGKDKNKNWRISLKWLKQHLQLPDNKFYSNVYQMEWKITFLEKTINFLRELHKPKIIGYFYYKIFQLVKDRKKQYRASFILDKVETFGLHEERIIAWDKLIDYGVIIKGSKGWYKTGFFISKKFKKLKVERLTQKGE